VKVNLPSILLAWPLSAPSFTVGPGGAINDAPGRFAAAKEEVVNWAITNTGMQTITVALTKFLKKSNGAAAGGYFEWITNNYAQLNPGETTHLYARVQHGPDNPPILDCLSYTIEVRATNGAFAFDYDPDGDIKP